MRLLSSPLSPSQLCFTVLFLHILVLASLSAAQDKDKEESRERSGGPAWGPWGEWSACSRTCGGGVYYQERTCLSVRNVVLKPEKCGGKARAYQSCNIHDCPEGSTEFREEQCSSFNDVPYEGSLYTWVPYLGGPSQHCQLNCMPKGENFYYTQAETAVDGTRCTPDSLNICVAGVCMEVGCDMMLNSTVVLDKCGECGGDNTSCKDISGEFTTKKVPIGEYNDIVTLPVGATSISVSEKYYSGNFLALRSVHGEYYINGDYRVTYPQTFQAAGTAFHYERQGLPDSQGTIEVFQSSGPLTEAVVVMLLTQGPNTGVTYEYSVPVGYEQDSPFIWSLGSYGECSVGCGGGIKHREVYCTRRVTSEVLADYYCSEVAKPATNATCNTDLCPPSWHIGDWSQCPRTCAGEGVMQQRSVICMRSTGANDREEADGEECLRVAGPEPEHFQNCNEDVPCPQWSTEEWSQCSEPCGSGVQTRTVTCGHVNNVGILDCDENDKPAEEQECIERLCSDLKWMVASDWTKCAGSCGEAMQSREIVCVDTTGGAYPEEACVNITKPEVMQYCEPKKRDKCKPKWVTTDWTECSASCGKGVRSRFTFCASLKKRRWVEVPSKRCKSPKPHTMEGCAAVPCQRGAWMTGDWSQCSRSCGVGTEERSIMCFLNGVHGDEEYCKKSNRPEQVQDCVNPVTCPADDGITPTPAGVDETTEVDDEPADFCSMAMDNGPCREFEILWYYDSPSGNCVRFWYGGCEGNDNRFSTNAACEAACREDKEKLTQEELCTLPKDVGPCEGNYPSFYYDVTTGSCEGFNFGGCQGNQNRFSGEDECEIICGTFDENPCTLPVDSGRCQESHQMWYYEIYSDTCNPFAYSGCFGNPNRFTSKNDCEDRCVQVLAPPTPEIPEGGINVCTLPVETGDCRDRILKWFHNKETQLCESFTYSGCDGNENNFETQGKCSQMCSSGVFVIFPDATTSVRPTTAPEPLIEFTAPPTRQPSLRTDASGNQGVLYTTPYPTIGPRTKCQFEREDRSMRGLIGQFIPRCTEEGLYQRLQCHASTGDCFCVDETTGKVYEDSYTRFGEPDCEDLYYSEKTTAAEASTVPSTTPKEFIRLDKQLNNSTRVREGSRLSLRCHITGNPTVEYMWYKGRKMLSDRLDRITIMEYEWGSRLIVENVDQNDEGKYVCRGRNVVGDLSTNGIVTVRGRNPVPVEPEIEDFITLDRLMNNDTNVREGARASLRCHITGSPSVEYYWYKDNRVLDDQDRRVTVQEYDWGTRLTIDLVTPNDAGVYECRGINTAGVVSIEGIITVKAAGTAPEISMDVAASTTLKAEATFRALCRATGVPTPSVTWTREGTPINELRLSRMSDRGGKLKVQQLVYGDAGEYVCTADNGVGPPVREAVTLQVVPVNVGHSLVVTAHEGDDVVLPCSSAGNYEVTISWARAGDHQLLGNDDRFTQRGDGSLRIDSVLLGDSNSYICTGRIGQSTILSKNFQLSVQADAVIVHPPTDQRARVGELVEFTCGSIGSPIPETRWYLNDVQVVENSRISFGSLGRLTINGVKSLDAGTYTCIVFNDISTTRASAEFVVIDDSQVDPNCVDSTEIADCQLIVLGGLCDTQFGPYCCRSCADNRN